MRERAVPRLDLFDRVFPLSVSLAPPLIRIPRIYPDRVQRTGLKALFRGDFYASPEYLLKFRDI